MTRAELLLALQQTDAGNSNSARQTHAIYLMLRVLLQHEADKLKDDAARPASE